MQAWNIVVIIVSILLSVILLMKELRRPNRARLSLRIISSATALVSLACLAIPIHCQRDHKAIGNELIVTTQGFNQDSIDVFRKNKTLTVLNENDFLADTSVTYDTVHVFGFGFKEDVLKSTHTNFIFHTTAFKTGITSIQWNQRINKGDELLLQGRYINETGGPVVLLLMGFHTVLDSFTVHPKQEQAFYLHDVPKQNGLATYSLVAIQGRDTLEKEPVPVEVINASPLKILILSGTPDFENKFLKDWLSQNGFTVANKTMISANKSERSFLNANSLSLEKITPVLLDSFDVLLSDETAINLLTKPEQENIYQQINSKGLGLIIHGDTITNNSTWFTRSFQLSKKAAAQKSRISITLPGNPYFKASLTGEEQTFIRPRNDMQPVAVDSAGNIVTANTANGSGKIAFTVLNNTYQWLLSGNLAQYHTYWKTLLQKTARDHRGGIDISISPALPVIQQQVSLMMYTKGEKMPEVKIDRSTLAFAQDAQKPELWTARYWPLTSGWQTTTIAGNSDYHWFAYEKNDWPYISAAEKIAAGRRYSEQKTAVNSSSVSKKESGPVPLFYFFLLFLISCGFLWMERKIS